MPFNSMRALVVAVAIAAVAPCTLIAAPLPGRAEHTVSYYRAHPQEMREMHIACTDDRTIEDYPDCKNAAAAGDSMVRGSASSPLADMYDPNSYRNDPVKRRVILAMCKTSTPPAAKVCQAAQEAGS